MQGIQKNSIQAWVLAARPKTLSGALVPVVIGTALAYSSDSFEWLPALICALFAGLMQIAANFINDLYDYLKGTDREDRLGPERACSQGWISPQAMRKGIFLIVAIACLIGLSLVYFGGWQLILVGILCVVFAFAYTTGPYPLSYHGYGDVLVLIFFGFVPVGGTYYVQALGWSWEVTLASLICGLAINTLLIVNNYRDYHEDLKSGKHTLIVRFGQAFGAQFYLIIGILSALLPLAFILNQYYLAALLPLLYLPLHIRTYREMKATQGKALNGILGKTSKNILLLGLLLSLGLILGY